MLSQLSRHLSLAVPAVDMGEEFRYIHQFTPYAACLKTRIAETTLGQQQ
jgi:hypothetical protein